VEAIKNGVSIPQSEFCPLGLSARLNGGRLFNCFNSSVGILSVGTRGWRRDAEVLVQPVSIPQSEFCPLGRDCHSVTPISIRWFQFLSRNSVRWDHGHVPGPLQGGAVFQFLSRNSVRWDHLVYHRRRRGKSEFQFLSRNSVRWDRKCFIQLRSTT